MVQKEKKERHETVLDEKKLKTLTVKFKMWTLNPDSNKPAERRCDNWENLNRYLMMPPRLVGYDNGNLVGRKMLIFKS